MARSSLLGSCVSMALCVFGPMCPGPMCPVLFVSRVLCGHPLTKFKRFTCRCLKQSQQTGTRLNYYYVTAFYFYFYFYFLFLSKSNNNHKPNNKITITLVGLRLSNRWEPPPTTTTTTTNSKLHDRAEIEQNSENKSY